MAAVEQTVVVFGANGGSGRVLVQQGLDAGHQVRAVTRHPEQFPLEHSRLSVVRTDVNDPESVDAVVEGADAVVSALGVPYTRAPITLYSRSARHIVEAMHRHKVRRLVVVSSTAVDPRAGSQGRFITDHLIAPLVHRLGRTLYADMQAMEDLVRVSGLDWTIVRPPALADAGTVGRYRTANTFIRGTYATRPDLAAFMLDELTAHARYRGEIAYIVSPDVHPNLLTTIWRDGLAKR